VKNILVTGGLGFIGSHTVVELIENDFNPIIVDNLCNSNINILSQLQDLTNTTIKHYNIDCCQKSVLEAVFNSIELDGVIHFAAHKSINESVQNPIKYYSNNLNSLINVLELMGKYSVKNIVFSSSCVVYGDPDNTCVTEKTPIQKAETPYGHTKQLCEDIIKGVNKYDITSAVILRYFNPIGAHPSGMIGELPIGTPDNLIPYVAQTAMGIRDELTVHGTDYNTPDGTCIRDYIHVMDLANSHIKSLEWMMEKNNNTIEIFNVGTGNGNSVMEVVNAFAKITEIKYKIGNRRDGDIAEIYADPTKINAMLKWYPKFNLEDALKHSWNWTKNYNKNPLF